jgi:hypothetical protein
MNHGTWTNRALGALLGVVLLHASARPCHADTNTVANQRIAVLRLKQEVRGLHRQRRTEGKGAPKAPDAHESVTLQDMTVDTSGQRLMLRTIDAAGKTANTPLTEGANRVVLRMDREPPEIVTFFDAERQYRAYEGDLNKYQDERDITEAHERRRILADQSMSKINQDAQLKKSFLRRDGKRVVEVEHGGTETVLGHPCREIKVTENGRVIIHAWITEDLGGGTSFYQLYRRLGTFSREVLDQIENLEGVPLRATIQLVTAGPPRKIEVRCIEVLANASVPSDFFGIPEGYEKFEEAPAVAPCPICSKRVERDQAGGAFADPIRKIRLHFCSRECRNKYIEGFKKRREAARDKGQETSKKNRRQSEEKDE